MGVWEMRGGGVRVCVGEEERGCDKFDYPCPEDELLLFCLLLLLPKAPDCMSAMPSPSPI